MGAKDKVLIVFDFTMAVLFIIVLLVMLLGCTTAPYQYTEEERAVLGMHHSSYRYPGYVNPIPYSGTYYPWHKYNYGYTGNWVHRRH
jgi:hypothetical protein